MELSEREREVVLLVRAGATPAEIAERLEIPESTARAYVANLRAKARDAAGEGQA